MPQFSKYKKFFTLIVATSILIWFIILTSKTRAQMSLPEKIVGYIVLPFQKSFSFVGNEFNNAYFFFHEIGANKTEKEKLNLEVQKQRDEIRNLNDIQRENVRLKQILGLKDQYKENKLEAAQVIGRNPENWDNIIVINRGTDNDIEINNAVMSINNGLIGEVIEVGPNWSKVMLITDSDSSVSSIINRTRELAVTKGDPVAVRYGYVKLTYLANDADIVTDDIITTSGFGGIYPKGILIGKVKEVKLETNGLTKFAYVQPVADFKTMEEVVVIRSVQGQKGVH